MNVLIMPPLTPRLRTLEQTHRSLLKAQLETSCEDLLLHAELRIHIDRIERAIRKAVEEDDTTQRLHRPGKIFS